MRVLRLWAPSELLKARNVRTTAAGQLTITLFGVPEHVAASLGLPANPSDPATH